MKTAVAFRHCADEGLGVFEHVLRQRSYNIVLVDVWKDAIDASVVQEADVLVVLGGPMGVYEADQYPFLHEEIRVIQDRLAAGKPILGVCLGSQLVAHAAGGRVFPGQQKEIGYAPVTLTPEGKATCLAALAEVDFLALHWHGDTFDLPPNAVRLASTAITANQAFSLGPNVLAVQFHLEALPHDVAAWADGSADYIASAGVRRDELDAAVEKHAIPIAAAGARILGQWLNSLT